MKIYLIRHGETTSDVENRYGGSYDDHLTTLGHEQLEETAKQLKYKDIQIIFSSKLIRAKESTEIINVEINVPVQIFDGIEERGSGILAGLTRTEAVEKYPEVVTAQKNPEYTVPEGESLIHFQERTLTAFKEVFAKDYKTVAIVSHGGPIKQLLKYFNMPLPPKIGDGEIIEIIV